MPVELAACLGHSRITSQRSTTLPPFRRKLSASAAGVVSVAGLQVKEGAGDNHIVLGDDALDVQFQVAVLAPQPAREADEGLRGVAPSGLC